MGQFVEVTDPAPIPSPSCVPLVASVPLRDAERRGGESGGERSWEKGGESRREWGGESFCDFRDFRVTFCVLPPPPTPPLRGVGRTAENTAACFFGL